MSKYTPIASLLRQRELLIRAVADMHSDTSKFGQPGRPTKDRIPQEYFCNRASGLSAGLQKQQSTRSENFVETVSSSESELNFENSNQT